MYTHFVFLIFFLLQKNYFKVRNSKMNISSWNFRSIFYLKCSCRRKLSKNITCGKEIQVLIETAFFASIIANYWSYVRWISKKNLEDALKFIWASFGRNSNDNQYIVIFFEHLILQKNRKELKMFDIGLFFIFFLI